MTDDRKAGNRDTGNRTAAAAGSQVPLNTDDRADADAFIAGLTDNLTGQLDELPEAVRLRLQQSRRSAALITEQRSPWYVSVRLPALVTGSAVAAMALYFGILNNPQVPELPVSSEFEFAAAQDAEVLEQLEFLAWLEEEAADAG